MDRLTSIFAPIDDHMWLLIVVTVVFGVAGGLVNFFLIPRPEREENPCAKCVVLGVGAALLVPLFLNMISSDLVSNSRTDASKLLVFGGFCLVAAVSARAFITTVTDKVLRKVEEVAETAKEATKQITEVKKATEYVELQVGELSSFTDAVAAASSNTSVGVSSVGPTVSLDIGPPPDVTSEEWALLKILTKRERFTSRSVNGLVIDSGLPQDVVEYSLRRLREKGFARSYRRQGLWYATPEGLALVIPGSPKSESPKPDQ